MTTITRLYKFSASHRLHSGALSEQENDRVYGKCNNPFGHGHDYVLQVTASGSIDPVTGQVVHIAALDRLVEETILRRFSNRNLNLDAAEFANLVPTTENLALAIANLLEQQWPTYFDGASARLARVHVQETDRNGFEVLLPAPKPPQSSEPPLESVHV